MDKNINKLAGSTKKNIADMSNMPASGYMPIKNQLAQLEDETQLAETEWKDSFKPYPPVIAGVMDTNINKLAGSTKKNIADMSNMPASGYMPIKN